MLFVHPNLKTRRRATNMARKTSIFTFVTFLIFFPFISSSHSSRDTFIYGGCTQQKYEQNSAYESNLNSLLTSFVNSATYSSYNNFTIMGSSSQDIVYGLYQCKGDLAMPDCAACVAHSVSQIGSLCYQTSGAVLQLEGCYIKYDNAKFLGVEDKTVLLKKCAPTTGSSGDAVRDRDAVLDGLASGGGQYYRVGGSGKVQGVAQCVGDLSMSECQDCVKEAIGLLKSECGGVPNGDMFLAKCYMRYSTGGSHSFFGSHGGSGKSNDDGVKTFAIIIGLLAGVAILIIFLAFMRKVFGRNGK